MNLTGLTVFEYASRSGNVLWIAARSTQIADERATLNAPGRWHHCGTVKLNPAYFESEATLRAAGVDIVDTREKS